jgi:hypothetical protein
VHHLVEIVRPGRQIQLWPQGIDELLAVQPVRGSERQELDQLTPLAQTPHRRVDRLAATRHDEPAEELDRDIPRQRRVTIGRGLQASTPGNHLSGTRAAPARSGQGQPYCVAALDETSGRTKGTALGRRSRSCQRPA